MKPKLTRTIINGFGLAFIFFGALMFAINLTTGRFAFLPEGFLFSTVLSVAIIGVGGVILFWNRK